MSNVGWFPDPGGQPGRFRYWDGRSWSAETTATPRQTPPPAAPTSDLPGPRKKAGAWWIAAVAAVLVIVLIIWAVVTGVQSANGDNPWLPNGNATPNPCPQNGIGATPSASNTDPGRVAAGHLSFPTLGSPWQPPSQEPRVPFAGVAAEQVAIDQKNYNGDSSQSWVSQVLVADITSGDGFGSTKAAAEQVLNCSLGIFYSDTVLTKKDLRSKAITVDGHSAWLLEPQLSFDIPGLIAKGERVMIVVVDIDPNGQTYGLFFSSVPDTRPENLPIVQSCLKQLRVDG